MHQPRQQPAAVAVRAGYDLSAVRPGCFGAGPSVAELSEQTTGQHGAEPGGAGPGGGWPKGRILLEVAVVPSDEFRTLQPCKL